MGYFNNAPAPPPSVGECDACVLVDNDYTPKVVEYCSICNAWLCGECRKSPWKRAKAALRRLTR
jgi:hypothetical protein